MYLKFATRNLLGQGARGWLNSSVLALALLAMIFIQGLNEGAFEQLEQSRIAEETAQAQFWHRQYDPIDPLSFKEAWAAIPDELVADPQVEPVLVATGTIYPRGRLQSVTLKGIDPAQQVLNLPFDRLATAAVNADGLQPVLLGRRMAERLKVAPGDQFTLRWRTAAGMFDALEVLVIDTFETAVPAMDVGQLWLPLSDLQSMLGLEGQASMVLLGTPDPTLLTVGDWTYKSLDDLLKETRELRETKRGGSVVMYLILLSLALVSVFDSQVLTVFKRRREIGVMMALGLTQQQVIRLFTIEGLMQGVVACGIAAVVGGPLLVFTARNGIDFGVSGDQLGMAISSVMYPAYSMELIVTSVVSMLVLLALVSWLPTRRIARMLPTQAIRGEW